MKVTVNTKELKGALKKGLTICVNDKFKPILSCVRLRVREDVLVVEANSLEKFLALRIDEVETEDMGAICVHAKTLHDYLNELKHEKVTLELLEDQNHMRVGAGRSRFHMNVIDPEVFPTVQTYNPEFFTMDATKLIPAFKKTFPFASSDQDTRLHLSGVAVTGGDVVATDGFRLAILTDPDFSVTETEMIIPKGSIGPICSMFENMEVVKFGVDDGFIFVQGEGTLFGTRLIAKSFPNYRNILSGLGTNAKIVKGNVEELVQAIKRLLIPLKIAKAANMMLKVQFNVDSLELMVSSPQAGEAAEIVEVEGFADSNGVLGINGNYLQNALESLEEDTFELHVSDFLKPVLFKEGGYTHVVMPLKI